MERNFISLGAGVQSSTLLLMACHGEITSKPEAAIFADTGWEPKLVYSHLEWLVKESEKYGIPVYNIQKGNIREDILLSASGEGGATVRFIAFLYRSERRHKRNGSQAVYEGIQDRASPKANKEFTWIPSATTSQRKGCSLDGNFDR